MTVIRCKVDPDSCNVEVDVDDPHAWLTRHLASRHPSPTAFQRVEIDWRTQALDAIAELAATRDTFTVFEVAELGVPEPPDPSHDWGRLTRDAHHMGLIRPLMTDDGLHHVAVESKRPGTKASLVKVWRGPERQRRGA